MSPPPSLMTRQREEDLGHSRKTNTKTTCVGQSLAAIGLTGSLQCVFFPLFALEWGLMGCGTLCESCGETTGM